MNVLFDVLKVLKAETADFGICQHSYISGEVKFSNNIPKYDNFLELRMTIYCAIWLWSGDQYWTVSNMNSAVMEGFISQEMKSSHVRKSGHNHLIQLALIIICFFRFKIYIKKKHSWMTTFTIWCINQNLELRTAMYLPIRSSWSCQAGAT